MIRRMVDTLARAALAFILATLVWVVAVQQENPIRVDAYPVALSIVLTHEPAGAFVYGQTADSVHVTLRAPQSMWPQLTADQFKAEVDLANKPFGELNLPVKVRSLNPAVQVVRVDPPTVDLHLESTAEQTVHVRITTTGEPALGYAARPATAAPDQVAVRGPASFVSQVAQVIGTINAQNARKDVEQTVRLSALDKDGNPVGYVTLTPETVQAHVIVEHLGGFRDLAVKVVVRGQVAPGYRISNITVSPPIVTVFGASQAIDASPGYVETVPVTVTNAQSDVVERAALNLPGGISLLGDPAVEVVVQVEAIQGGLTVERPLTVQGLGQGLEARLSPETIDVILTGPLPKLQSLKPDDVRVLVDLVDLGVGTHQVTPQPIVPQGVVAETMLPATIQVTVGYSGTLNLSPLPTPTRTITATAVVTPTRTK